MFSQFWNILSWLTYCPYLQNDSAILLESHHDNEHPPKLSPSSRDLDNNSMVTQSANGTEIRLVYNKSEHNGDVLWISLLLHIILNLLQ